MESLKNSHSRKSSTIIRDIQSAKSSKNSEQIAQILNAAKDQDEHVENDINEVDLNIEVAPMILTHDEELNHAEAKLDKICKDPKQEP